MSHSPENAHDEYASLAAGGKGSPMRIPVQIYLLCVLLMITVLAGCSESTAPPGLPGQPPADPPPPDGGACAVTLSEDVTVPTTLSNTASACDYLLDGFVEVSSTLTIEPGVVVRATQDASLWVEGGQLLAVGTPEARITLEGLNRVSGYWEGIRFAEGRESRLEYVDLKDAGQVCAVSYCPDAGLILDDVTVSLVNVSVSNSYVHGVSVSDTVLFTAFANNRFYGNTWSGIILPAQYVPLLDAGSDYSGQGAPNGDPYVFVGSGDLVEGVENRWRNLNAPYLIAGYLNVAGGVLALEPGVTVVFGEEAWLDVEGNGVLSAVGTADAPITLKGAVEKPGYWDGVTFDDSPWEENRLEHVHIRHSGNVDNALPAYGAVRLEDDARVRISHSLIEDNAQYGVACSDPEDDRNVLELVATTFRNNASGDVDPDCGVTP